ncbi:Dolichyl-phosphate-mannose-protein mannosyltransferase [uncultured archaeon]|nr:Dolichyl-phosphate-mannose-protein mannosyltransferase [uncultured archaeon]
MNSLFDVEKKNSKQDGESRIQAALFLITFAAYVASTTGIASPIDGGHYALAKAIVDEHTLKIDKNIIYASHGEYTKKDGHYYLYGAPGTALMAVPFYAAGKIVSFLIQAARFYDGADYGNPALFYVLLLPALSSAISVILVYRISRLLGAKKQAAAISSAVFAFGTLNWKYATLLLPQSPSSMLILIGIYVSLKSKKIQDEAQNAVLLGFALGASIALEYMNAVPCAVILIYLIWSKKINLDSLNSNTTDMLLSLMIPILILASYNTISFGGPLNAGYAYKTHVSEIIPNHINLTDATLSNRLITLITGNDKLNGLLAISPILILSIFGISHANKKQNKETALLTALPIITLTTYAILPKYWADFYDTPYLLTAAAALTPLIAVGLQPFTKKNAQSAIYGIIFLSLSAYCAFKTAEEVVGIKGHSIREFTLSAGGPIQSLSTNFDSLLSSARNAPYALGLVILAYSLWSLFRALRASSKSRQGNVSPVSFAVVGLILISLSLAVPEGSGNIRIVDWKYSEGGIDWAYGNYSLTEPILFKSNLQRVYVKVLLDIPPKTASNVVVAAGDCIRTVYVNREMRLRRDNCTVCLDCEQKTLNLSVTPTFPGVNSMEFEVESLENTASFNIAVVSPS